MWTWVGPPGWTGPGSSPDVVDGIAYFGSGDTHVYALDLDTGHEIWSTKLASSVNQVVRCGDFLLVHRYHLEVLERETGRAVDLLLGGDEFLVTEIAVAGGQAWFGTYGRLMSVRCD